LGIIVFKSAGFSPAGRLDFRCFVPVEDRTDESGGLPVFARHYRTRAGRASSSSGILLNACMTVKLWVIGQGTIFEYIFILTQRMCQEYFFVRRCELFIDRQEIVCFGDDINDLPMMKCCGVSVAVDNAIDDVKKCADSVCDSNDNDGVAKWLENRLL
jgi:hypothetical protein